MWALSLNELISILKEAQKLKPDSRFIENIQSELGSMWLNHVVRFPEWRDEGREVESE